MMYKQIYASGSNYEIGLTHGKLAIDEIGGTIRHYRQKFQELWQCDWNTIKEFSNTYYSVIQNSFPQYIEEMKGISDGSGFSFDDILAINCHYELARKGNLVEHSCSVIGVDSSRSDNGHTYLAENWDYSIPQRNNSVILHLTLPKNLKLCMLTEGGIIGRMGYNNYGIGYCGNTMKNDFVGAKLPLHMIKRGILEQSSLQEIYTFVNQYAAGSSYNLMVESASDGGMDFEVDYAQISALQPDQGLLLHTNHFLSKHLISNPAYIKYQKTESVERYQGLRDALFSLPRISFQDIKATLSSHSSDRMSICVHEDPSLPLEKQWATIWSLIIDLSELKMYVCKGNPCQNSYDEITLD